MRRTALTRTKLVLEQIKHLISNKCAGENLPSERTLCQSFVAGRTTIREALKQLEKSGAISAPGIKSTRKILKPLKSKKAPIHSLDIPKKIGIISTLPVRKVPQTMLVESYQLEQFCLSEGMSVQIFEMLSTAENIDYLLEKIVKKNPCSCWILYRVNEKIQLWFKKKNLPCLVRGSTYPSARLPFLERDWPAVVHHAATQLWQKGHRRIMLCVPAAKLQGNLIMEKTFLDTPLGKWEPLVVKVPERGSDFIEKLNTIFKNRKHPTATIVVDGYSLIPLMTWCQLNKISIPTDLSVICLTYQRFMHDLNIKFSVYADVHGRAARKTFQMTRSIMNGSTVRGYFIVPEFVRGETIIPPKNRRIEIVD